MQRYDIDGPDYVSFEGEWVRYEDAQAKIDELNECLEQALSELEYWQDKANELEYNQTGV